MLSLHLPMNIDLFENSLVNFEYTTYGMTYQLNTFDSKLCINKES